MTNENSHADTEPKLGEILREDFRRGDFKHSLPREFKELKEFMLTEERHRQLKEMNLIQRWFYITWWLLKSLFLKLTPLRRLLLLAGIIFILASRSVSYSGHQVQVSNDTNVLGILCILFVLMLELKDKLIAKKELDAGHAVQNALMPERSPRVPGWNVWLFTRSANEVSGDLVDFVKVSEARYGIALGDVAGKGLGAALLTAKLQAMLRTLVTDFSSLGELGVKLNHIFCRDSLRNVFASLVYLELEPDSGAVRLLNAGHFPPIIIRETSVDKMEKGGAALGIMPNATYMEQRIELHKDESLLVYSDGLTEARNEAGEFFGEQRLLALLPHLGILLGGRIGEELVAALDTFVGETKANDDLSIVLIKRAI